MSLLKPKYFLLFVIAVSVFSSLAFYQQTENPVLAVLDLEGEGVTKSEAKVITGFVEEAIFNINLYKLVSRTQIDKILKELEYQQSGICGLECAVNIGQHLAATKVAIGTIGLLGKTYSIQIKIIDVKSSKVEKIRSVRANCELGQLPDYIGSFINDLFGIENTELTKKKTSDVTNNKNEIKTTSTGTDIINEKKTRTEKLYEELKLKDEVIQSYEDGIDLWEKKGLLKEDILYDKGTVVATNKRIIFIGTYRIIYKSILGLTTGHNYEKINQVPLSIYWSEIKKVDLSSVDFGSAKYDWVAIKVDTDKRKFICMTAEYNENDEYLTQTQRNYATKRAGEILIDLWNKYKQIG